MATTTPGGSDMTSYPMYQWATDLFPVHRSLTGDGVRQTLRYLKELLPNLVMHEAPSGTQAFDWTVPKEWVIREAYVADNFSGHRVIDIKNSNLHVVQYSAPFKGFLSGKQLDEHLYSLPEQPDAIPYVTSYYKENWGFCVSHRQREELIGDKNYRVVIDSELKDGHLTYGELIIPGKDKTEVLLSTNICHPSMANNELSGPVVVTALAQWLASAPRRHTYRILFLPETIGALVYLSEHIEEMKAKTVAGYQVVCCGDEGEYFFLPSRNGETLADRAADAALVEMGLETKWLSFLVRGSDERQWCAPGIDLPVASIMRSKYDAYPEYHTSLDDLSFISQKGLEGTLAVYQRAIEIIEANRIYKATTLGEPQLGKRGLYPGSTEDKLHILNVLAYADGSKDLIDIAETIGINVLEAATLARILEQHGLLEGIA